MKVSILLLAALTLAGCNRGGADSRTAVRQGVLDYLAGRSNLSVAAMNVEVTSVEFNGDRATAAVAITPKGADAGQAMSIRYALERQGNRWVVTGREDTGGQAHEGAAIPDMGGSPHGSGETPGMHGGGGRLPGELPPGHPETKTEKK